MVLMSFGQIILRSMDQGLLWGDIFLRHLVLWVGFVGASLATRDDKHISIDVLSRITSEKANRFIKIIVNFATIVVCLVLAEAAYEYVKYEYEEQSILFNELPRWPFQIIMPLGFAMIAFRLIIKILQDIPLLFNNAPETAGDA